MRRLLTLAFLLVLGFSPASAAIIGTYSSQGDFLTGVSGGSYVETFSSIRIGSSLSYSGNGYAYTITASHNMQTLYGRLQTVRAGEMITFTFTSGTVTAVGAGFFAVNLLAQPAGTTVTLNFADGSSRSIAYTPSSAGFTGYTFDTPLSSFSMAVQSSLLNGRWAALDNLVVGTANQPVDTPEPGAWMLLSTGIGLLALGRFTRRRTGRTGVLRAAAGRSKPASPSRS